MNDGLNWLPRCDDFRPRVKALSLNGNVRWQELVELAAYNLDFVQTNQIDRHLLDWQPEATGTEKPIQTVRIAILSSSTVSHLHAAIRVAGLRRRIQIFVYECDFGQYRQELLDPHSNLYSFQPNIVLFAFDGYHLLGSVRAGSSAQDAEAALDAALAGVSECWSLAKSVFGCTVIQQAVLPIFADILGNNEHRFAGSRASLVVRMNSRLRKLADQSGTHVLSVDHRAARDGIEFWHDVALWHRSKQEIRPPAAPLYGDLVGRLVAALLGRSSKCLVLDLDNTIWGGVVGDDGLEGIVLGQGSAAGEAFVAFQSYASMLSERGIILAVCSKNDEAVALKAFNEHPEMVLKRSQIASFKANWTDKATNIRTIAAELNIGLDSLIFADDNPFERSLLRKELPMVNVPELPEDPALYPQCLADAGYFESISITDDDRARTAQYQLNRVRAELMSSTTDMDGYLQSLKMVLQWRSFDKIGLQRTVQLINKTNQFNLTTRRYTEEAVLAVMSDPDAIGLQLRLIDKFGDNGIIAIIIGKRNDNDLLLDTWLMSCRVIGRKVEQATLNILVDEAKRLGVQRIIGEYRPTEKNGMVREHYQKLGFSKMPFGAVQTEDERHSYVLPLDEYNVTDHPIQLERA